MNQVAKQQNFANEHSLKLIAALEASYFKIYHLENHPSVLDFQISDEELSQLANFSNNSFVSSNGNIVFVEDLEAEEMHIGFHLSDKMLDSLKELLSAKDICLFHLNAICTCIEEMSHFHLLINRAQKNRSTSQLELEYQAEIDKAVLTSIFFRNQWQIEADQVFEEVFKTAPNPDLPEHYSRAFVLARSFFDDFLNLMPNFHSLLEFLPFRSLIKQNYYAAWQDKLTVDGVHSKGVQFKSLFA